MAVLEGIHALKHAIRFDAAIESIVTRDRKELESLAGALAPDIVGVLRRSAAEVGAEAFASLAPAPPDTGVIALARRRVVSAGNVLRDEQRSAPAVLLEDPTHRGNAGATIRVSAAAGASAVVTTGPLDVWDPAVLRGSAGLHYALPVARMDGLADWAGPLIALDPSGERIRPEAIPSNAILAFGSERRGVSPELRAKADLVLAIPMEEGVSSLNLATAVAGVLYAWRLGRPA
jgi:tRNA G18 (ribose-2'-O)-methylase SpoU